MNAEFDAFVSHASEDKTNFVKPLSELLTRMGLKVWYDEATLRIGDSLSRSIDRGLVSSRYGIVVLSPSFLTKNWPEYELRGLTSREIDGKKVILPIWHGITREELMRYSPTLADKYALDTSRLPIHEIAFEILQEVRPDIFENFQRIQARRAMISSAKVNLRPMAEIKPGPIRHRSLPKAFRLRAKLVYLALGDIYDGSLEGMLNNFRRDLHPEDELLIWENIAAAYLEGVSQRRLHSHEDKRQLFWDLLGISLLPRAKDGQVLGGDADLINLYDNVIPPVPDDDAV